MTNDKPTSLRMGFGYEQARVAGLGGIRTDRSARQVNKIIKANKSAREATERLEKLMTDPDWKRLIRHRLQEGVAVEMVDEEIGWIKSYANARRRGHSLSFRLKHCWPY